MRGFRLTCTFVLLSGVAGAQSLDSGVAFTTAKGYSLTLTPPAALSCEQIQTMLAAIDDSGYREGLPVPPNPADRPLYEYELDLAAFNYERCVLHESGVTPGYNVFRRGN